MFCLYCYEYQSGLRTSALTTKCKANIIWLYGQLQTTLELVSETLTDSHHRPRLTKHVLGCGYILCDGMKRDYNISSDPAASRSGSRHPQDKRSRQQVCKRYNCLVRSPPPTPNRSQATTTWCGVHPLHQAEVKIDYNHQKDKI